MRIRKMRIMLGASSLIIVFLTVIYCCQIYQRYRIPIPYEGRVLGIPIVKDMDFLKGKTQATSDRNPGVYLEHTLLPYTSDGTLYLAQDYRIQDWIGELSADEDNAYLCMPEDEAWNDKASCIRNNHIFQIYLVEEDIYYSLKLIVSGMPVMALTTERVEDRNPVDYETDPDEYFYGAEQIAYGQMQLFDPCTGTSRYEILESGVKYHLRGDSSASFDKKSYAVGILDPRGNNLSLSLLGMRSDNSWKLKGMAIDHTRINEKTAWQVWEQFASTNMELNETGSRMEYLELVVDNDYVGIYGLLEPVDAKTLGLDGNDVLYKATRWNAPTDDEIEYAVEHGWRVMSYLRIRYPDDIIDYEKTWYPIRDYLNTFYYDAGDERSAGEKIYVSNVADMLIFNMAISGNDNYFKNMFFAADVSETGEYAIRQIPWDLDQTFGTVIGGEFLDDETVIYEEKAGKFLRDNYSELICPYLNQRWQEARASFLSAESMERLLRDNRDYLVNTGAVKRENVRWPQYEMSTDLTQIEDLLERRLNWLDEYFAGF